MGPSASVTARNTNSDDNNNEKVQAWDQLSTLQVDSSMTIGSFRSQIGVPHESRLILLFRDLTLHRTTTRSSSSHAGALGIPLDNRLEVALHDVPELQPCYAEGHRTSSTLPEVYHSPPIKFPGSFAIALFFVKAEGLAQELQPQVTFPFPFWVEVDQSWAVRSVVCLDLLALVAVIS